MSPWTLPQEVELGDITVRDGLQALEHFIPTAEKLRIAEDLVLAGYKHVELTNFGNPRSLPQFQDAEELLARFLESERVGSRLVQNGGDVTVTVVAINERAVERVLDFKRRHTLGPDYVLQMVSTDPEHHRVNSGMSVEEYLRMSERCARAVHAQGIRFCGTVSTIWGSPIAGHRETRLQTALELTQRYLDIGADYVEHADHDGSADPARVHGYFSTVLDPGRFGRFADPKLHLAHFHTTRGMGMANYLAALLAGVCRFETTLSGVGGQPANVMDGRPVSGTGAYYHAAHLASGLVGSEDFVTMLQGMGIETGIDLTKLLAAGRRFRDEVLRIDPASMRSWIQNTAQVTGLPERALWQLPEEKDQLDSLADDAAQHLRNGGGAGDDAKAVAEQLLKSTVHYLRTRQWAPSRAESLEAGPLRAESRRA